MISKWAQRFYENIDPCPGEMGFDGLGNLETKTENKVKINNECSKEDKECMRLGFRMDELKDRISHHAGSPATLSWNKNVQCPPKTWDGLLSKEGRVIYKECKADSHKRICVKWYNTETYNFVSCFCEDPEPKEWKPGDKDNRRRAWESTSNQESLILPRHNPYGNSLEIADYVSSYFPPRWPDVVIAYEGNTTSKDKKETKYGFWLINEDDAPFVYAILKSSMFRAWCELTAYTDKWTDKKGHKHQGAGHFAVGMWDTFPLPNLTCSQKGKIITAGRELQEGREDSQKNLDKIVDGLFISANSIHDLTDKYRKRILAGEFLKMFLSLKIDVVRLAKLQHSNLSTLPKTLKGCLRLISKS